VTEWRLGPIEADEDRRQERSIAVARVFVALVASAALVLPAGASRADWVPLVTLAYSGFAVAMLLLYRKQTATRRRALLGGHAVDVGVATLATLGAAGGVSVSATWTFPILAAGYRWGLHGALATSAAAIVVLASSSALLSSASAATVTGASGSGLVVQAAQLGIAAFLVGYLADRERQRRREVAGIARVSRTLRLDLALPDVLGEMAGAIGGLFGAEKTVLAFTDRRASSSLLIESTLDRPGGAGLTVTDADEETLGPLQFEVGTDVWHAAMSKSGRWRRIRGLRWRSTAIVETDAAIPRSFLERYPCRGVIGLSLPIGGEWAGRMWLIDPAGFIPVDALQFARRLAEDVGSLVRLAASADTVRSRAASVERARLARELHDGIAQTLASADARLEALTRRAATQAPALCGDVGGVQGLLREGSAALKDLMRGMKSEGADARSGVLLDELSDMVARFARETGIAARFESDRHEIALSPRQSTEVRRILQEGLINVRKHSGARRVDVRATAAGQYWQLSIGDDGRGFTFRGRLSHEELSARRLGPVVIGERVRALGGELTIESNPGKGARLDVIMPIRAA
jgi:signal transduction histidine kinase